ncbi:MAG: isocitrate lyase, partial [Candidatus Eremiobacteraeota bacterium]|nr:isocitrate lyase [Candidatus Eremiobacteraeota bacterium]
QTIARFRGALNEMGYKFQFVTLAGFHAINYSFFKLAYEFNRSGMTAYADFQAHEFADESLGYTATRHQREVGTGYFDEVAEIVGEGKASTTALHGSTERDQFYEPQAKA